MSDSFLYLRTIGRRSGMPREIEIWFTESDGRYYVIAEHETSDWVQNLTVNPGVTFRVGAQQFSGTARIINSQLEPDLHGKISRLSEQKYGWGDGLVVELVPKQHG